MTWLNEFKTIFYINITKLKTFKRSLIAFYQLISTIAY